MKKILSIAASDPTCGAGIQADIRTISVLGGHPVCCITAVTAQNTQEVRSIWPLSPQAVWEQLEAILLDGVPAATKIGMLYDEALVMLVVRAIRYFGLKNTVLDPILISSTGQALVTPRAFNAIAQELVPIVSVITPNRKEALALLGRKGLHLDMEEVGYALRTKGPDVIITGGDEDALDLLLDANGILSQRGQRLATRNTHGTGCVFSSALATCLGHGFGLRGAFIYAKRFVTRAIKGGYSIGEGHGVLDLT